MKRCGDIFVLLIIACSLTIVCCDLSLETPKCGQVTCKRNEYCSPYHNSCDQCSKICERSSHNYDRTECEKSCQDYIHDTRYVSKDGMGPGDENLRATVQRLSHMVTVTLVLIILMLLGLVVVLSVRLYRWKKKKNITWMTIKTKFFSKKSDPPQNKQTTNSDKSVNEKPDLRLEIPTESVHSGNSPVTVTTSISRRPAEDSTLDYAYDNPVMSSSPSNKTNPNSF